MGHYYEKRYEGIGEGEDEYDFSEKITETDKSWLLKYLNFKGQVVEDWFPKSQCEIDLEDLKIIVPNWLAIEKSLIVE